MKKVNYLEKYSLFYQICGDFVWIHQDGKTYFYPLKEKDLEKDEDLKKEGKLFSPTQGRLLKINKKDQDLVEKGELILVIESMKIEYNIRAPFKGTLHLSKLSEKQTVYEDDFLAEVIKKD